MDSISLVSTKVSFSYAEIPKYCQVVSAITGTLETLSRPEAQVLMDDLGVKPFTLSPSVYGGSPATFLGDSVNDCRVVGPEFHRNNNIIREIEKKRTISGGNQARRAVFVFFDTERDWAEDL